MKMITLAILIVLFAAPIAHACYGYYDTVSYRTWVPGYYQWVDTSHYETYAGGVSRGGIVQYSTRWVSSGYYQWIDGYWSYSYAYVWRGCSPRICH